MGGALQPLAMKIPGHDGAMLHVNYYAGSGPAVVFTHCVGGLSRLWEPVIAVLGGRVRAYAIDMRGHGLSEQPQHRDAYAWADQGRDVLAVTDAVGLGPGALAVGHSGGAAHLAYAELFRPGLFRRMVLIDMISGPAEIFQPPSPLIEGARRRRNVFASRAEARARFAEKPPKSQWDAAVLDRFIEHGLADQADGQAALRLPGPIEAWFYELGGSPDLFERLGELRTECLLLSGSESNIAPLVHMQAERLPHARLHIVAGASHFLPQEQPAHTAALIAEGLALPGAA